MAKWRDEFSSIKVLAPLEERDAPMRMVAPKLLPSLVRKRTIDNSPAIHRWELTNARRSP